MVLKPPWEIQRHKHPRVGLCKAVLHCAAFSWFCGTTEWCAEWMVLISSPFVINARLWTGDGQKRVPRQTLIFNKVHSQSITVREWQRNWASCFPAWNEKRGPTRMGCRSPALCSDLGRSREAPHFGASTQSERGLCGGSRHLLKRLSFLWDGIQVHSDSTQLLACNLGPR